MRIDLTKFASKERPLRCSNLPMFFTCEWRTVLLFAKEYEDSVGTAAHTGSAAHRAIEVWHDIFDYDQSLHVAKQEQQNFPKVDWSEVELYFRNYTQDSRNRDARILAKEKKFTLTLEENEEEPIVLSGTIDQIRLDKGRILLYDLKTGKTYGGATVLDVYTMQLASYWVGAVDSLGMDVVEAGVINLYDYRSRSGGQVFWKFRLSLADCRHLLKGVVKRVKAIRSGSIAYAAGPHCQFCPAGSPANCIPIHQLKVKS